MASPPQHSDQLRPQDRKSLVYLSHEKTPCEVIEAKQTSYTTSVHDSGFIMSIWQRHEGRQRFCKALLSTSLFSADFTSDIHCLTSNFGRGSELHQAVRVLPVGIVERMTQWMRALLVHKLLSRLSEILIEQIVCQQTTATPSLDFYNIFVSKVNEDGPQDLRYLPRLVLSRGALSHDLYETKTCMEACDHPIPSSNPGEAVVIKAAVNTKRLLDQTSIQPMRAPPPPSALRAVRTRQSIAPGRHFHHRDFPRYNPASSQSTIQVEECMIIKRSIDRLLAADCANEGQLERLHCVCAICSINLSRVKRIPQSAQTDRGSRPSSVADPSSTVCQSSAGYRPNPQDSVPTLNSASVSQYSSGDVTGPGTPYNMNMADPGGSGVPFGAVNSAWSGNGHGEQPQKVLVVRGGRSETPQAQPPISFPCVWDTFRGASNPTPYCCKRKRYVAQLEPHHGCSAHELFYCTVCWTRFESTSERDDHKSRQCNFRCVTQNCRNYERDPRYEQPCLHGLKNNPLSKWKKIYRMAHRLGPDAIVPHPDDIHDDPVGFSAPFQAANTYSEPSTSIQQPTAQIPEGGGFPFLNVVPASYHAITVRAPTETPLPHPDPVANATSRLVERETSLQTLAASLWPYVDQPQPAWGAPDIAMFDAFMGAMPQQGPLVGDHLVISRVQQLETLIWTLRAVIEHANLRTIPRWRSLRLLTANLVPGSGAVQASEESPWLGGTSMRFTASAPGMFGHSLQLNTSRSTSFSDVPRPVAANLPSRSMNQHADFQFNGIPGGDSQGMGSSVPLIRINSHLPESSPTFFQVQHSRPNNTPELPNRSQFDGSHLNFGPPRPQQYNHPGNSQNQHNAIQANDNNDSTYAITYQEHNNSNRLNGPQLTSAQIQDGALYSPTPQYGSSDNLSTFEIHNNMLHTNIGRERYAGPSNPHPQDYQSVNNVFFQARSEASSSFASQHQRWNNNTASSSINMDQTPRQDGSSFFSEMTDYSRQDSQSTDGDEEC